MVCLADALAFAHDLADAARPLALQAWRGELAVRCKPDGSSLTEADLAIEALWRERIRARFPDHGILGEEYGQDAGTSAFTWVIDPIDGTRQFGAGLANIAALIALCRDGRPVLGVIELPLAGARYSAAAGSGAHFAGRRVRTSGRQGLGDAVVSLANPDSFRASAPGFRALREAGRLRVFDGGAPAYGALARGLVDLCVNGDDLDPYDICALCPVVQEAGGLITDWRGAALTLASKGAIVASASSALHAQALARLGAA